MIKFLWWALGILDNNWGYTTPLQKRFKKGDECVISQFKTPECRFVVGTKIYILETARHDYLIQNEKGIKEIVYQFELTR